MTSPGLSTRVWGIIGSLSGSVYSWMSRSFWTVRSGSDRNGHWAPTDRRNSWSVWCASVAMVAIPVYATANFAWCDRQLEVLLVLLRAVVAACQRQDERVVALDLPDAADGAGVVGQRVVGEDAAGADVGTHGVTSSAGAGLDGSLIGPAAWQWPAR